MNNERYYLLTGAAGFLGTNICMQLLEKGCKVRALVLPNDKSVKFIPKEVEVVLGDLTDAPSLEPFFTVPEGCTSIIIHCASMVTVNPNYSEKLMAVNVGGTRNIITKVLNHPECEKMVYVSSTGAIPEEPHGIKIREVSKFTPCDPKKVVGAYSQSKAAATQMVLDAVNVMGLKACVVHPSGILGPNDHAIGETTGTLLQIIKGEMPMGMQGSFNLCDVRDLAAGTIAAIDKGRIGQCYILANKTVTLKDMCDMLHAECNAKKIKFYLPLDLADKIAAGLEKQAEKTGKMPLMTTFSVYNLARNNEFDYSKAEAELGYTTRSYEETIHDEVQWMIAEGLIDGNGVTEKPTLMTNEQIREGGYMEDIIKAMEHEIYIPEIDVAEAYKSIETGVVNTYEKIETGVVSGYKKVEEGAVSGFRKISDKFIQKFFSREGETVEETRNRLSRK
ncbi:MAG: NAD-dependent epimerase/dehydratase family protein [Ruminococcaceae bacterium]|nr:NAD-dependent epimerase/dehydratase family protein [Oscillospiraceae bacterium]